MNGFFRIWIACAAVLLAAGCGYNDFGEPHPENGVVPLPNMSVGTLRERCTAGPVSFSGSGVVLSGYVTTSDRAGNFYRSLMLEDNSGAVEVYAGLYDLHNDYPVGCRLVLPADGLTAALDDGLLRIGLPGGSDAEPVVAMESPVIVRRHLLRTDETIAPAALPMTIAGLNDDRLGRLVRISRLCLDTPSDTTWAVPAKVSVDGTPRSALLKFRCGTDSVYVYTSGYASFAGERVPHVPVSVTGILLSGKVGGRRVYELKMRDLNDVQVD